MILERLKHDRVFRRNSAIVLSTLVNGAYAIGNFALGVQNGSYWFVTTGAYFLVLCAMRAGCLSALHSKSKKKIYVGRLVGLLLIILCLVLGGSIFLSDRFDVVKPTHEILMIAIAFFTTVKTTMAVINIVKASRSGDPIWIAIRNISCADAAGSILTMQRSMLVSFGEMDLGTVRLMNLLTGIGVCILVLILGLRLLKRK